MRVKLNPDCYKNHRPPHVPWYINFDITGLATEGLKDVFFEVEPVKGSKHSLEVIHATMYGEKLTSLTEGTTLYVLESDCKII